jgi:nanoRNase/pAp phosphatase (c-di-AMP/oligoRNAs hydrolase)
MPFVDFAGIVAAVRERAGTRTMLTFHSIGDTDSISSAVALSRVFKDSVISAPDRVTSNASRIMGKLGFDSGTIKSGFVNDAETVVMLDVNNFEGCGEFCRDLQGFKGKILVIDHHRAVEDKGNMSIFSNESYNSAASISYDILKSLNVGLDERLAKLLALGILSDSAEFKNTTPETFGQLGDLFKAANTDYISLITAVGHISPAEDRVKTVEDVAKANIFVREGLLFIEGPSHANANLAADSAIRIGADVSLFYSLGREVSLSARLRPTLDKKCGVHLGRIMKQLSPIIDGTGGGHPCAAGAYGSNGSRIGDFAREFMEMIIEGARKAR